MLEQKVVCDAVICYTHIMGNSSDIDFERMLTGGHPNSLGNTVEAVELVLKTPELFPKLFGCYQSKDEVVRLRVSNAMKRIARVNPELVYSKIDSLLNETARIDQASTQWTLAQLFDILQALLTADQKKAAIKIMKKNVEKHTDWIVLTQTMEVLTNWSKNDSTLVQWLLTNLPKHERDQRKSVAGKATKCLQKLSKLK